jgi:hypothetical protein
VGRSEHVETFAVYCPHCVQVTEFVGVRQRAAITLVGMPVVPLGRGKILMHCTRCGTQTTPDALANAQGQQVEQIALALRAATVYLFRRVPDPDSDLLVSTGELLAGCYTISAEYSAVHLQRDIANFTRYDCLDYVAPLPGLMDASDREDFFRLVAVIAIGIATRYESRGTLDDLGRVGDRLRLPEDQLRGIVGGILDRLG